MANYDPHAEQNVFSAQDHDPVIKIERDAEIPAPMFAPSPGPLFPSTPQLPGLNLSMPQCPQQYPSASAIMANDIESLGTRITATEALLHTEMQEMSQQIKTLTDRIKTIERRYVVLKHNEMCRSINPFAIRTGVLPITPPRSFSTGRLLPGFPNTYTRFWDLSGEDMSGMLEQLEIAVIPSSSLRIKRMKLMLVSGVPAELVNRDV
ncbi:hypothetical protein CDD82_1703 [Ophiocordyceps australis]|uniref:Uncharacterized protein n=1 Tax=Ophiocordyceps australis TaxID=1399860 RepID=A0A2C5XJQ3_9HYPO|nr:hypothetical protein CDD82_1703 [Ophiocordyceps australis]